MIRSAVEHDLPQLQQLHDRVVLDVSRMNDSAYAKEIQEQGFLLGSDDPHSLQDELEHAYALLVFEQDAKLLGYLLADHRHEQKFYDDEYKTWFDEQLKDFYYNDPHGMSVSGVAVDPQHAGEGIATQLLHNVEERLRVEGFSHLFSIVSMTPLQNRASFAWHLKQGFKKMAEGRPRTLFGIEQYSAVLLYKRI